MTLAEFARKLFTEAKVLQRHEGEEHEGLWVPCTKFSCDQKVVGIKLQPLVLRFQSFSNTLRILKIFLTRHTPSPVPSINEESKTDQSMS